MVEAYKKHSELVDFFDAPFLLLLHRDQKQALTLKDYLERQGFKVELVYLDHQAYTVVHEKKPDLVIVDTDKPDLEALDLCQTIKQDRSLGYLPIIMLTEEKGEDQRLSVMLSGADETMLKPFTPRELLLRVQAFMWTKRQIDSLIEQNTVLADNLAVRDQELSEAREIANQVRIIQRHFIRNVNHELRTPLLQIKTSISMLRDIVKNDVGNPQANTLATMATQATARLESVVQNITQLEIFEHTRREPMVLTHAVNVSIKHFQRSWSYNNVNRRIEAFLGVDLPPVIGDQRAVTRILVILIENALKFSEEDQPVEISVRWLKDEKMAWIGVRDYGIGIAEEDYERIFEAFTQLDTGSTKEYGGLGVGLSIARMLANNLGTDLIVDSTPGAGSVFSFKLPVLDTLEK